MPQTTGASSLASGPAGGDLTGSYPNPTVASAALGIVIGSGYSVSWGSSGTATPDTFLYRAAANMISQRNGTTAQQFNVTNTYTDASNYERGILKWASNAFTIGVERAGTGSNRAVNFVGATFNFAGPVYPSSTGTNDLGATTATWRSYFGSGGITLGIAGKSADYTLTANDYTIKVDASGAARTMTLPASPVTGQIYVIKKVDSSVNTVTVASNGKNIDGAASVTLLTQYALWRGQYDGTTWNTL